ncbi:MAG: copper homeostasis protein CutC [Bacteroidetes bacterium]|nr:copper homeostasis protein CutC [Bacteroidota bacterium]
MSFELEVIAFDLFSCLVAENAGAHRIELCANPHEGGTTPSFGMMRMARKASSIQLFPIIRPRGGDFIYDKAEFLSMIEDIKIAKNEGCDGVVIGMLKKDGAIDIDACHDLIHHANGMEVTFHRAFDRVNDQEKALEEVIKLGCTRILTSGGHPTAMEGKDQLQQLVSLAGNRIKIMVGSGIRSSNIKEIQSHTKASVFHASARKTVSSMMDYEHASMHGLLEKISIDEQEVRLLRSALEEIFA